MQPEPFPDPAATPADVAPDTAARTAGPPVSELRMGLVGGLMSATGPVSVTILTPAYPALAARFGAEPTLVAASATLFFVGFSAAHLICGALSDGLGRRRVGIAFFSIFLFGSLLAMLAPGIEWLLAARLVQGIGASAGISIARALIRDLFSGQQSARVVNRTYLVLGIGPALAPVIGSALLSLAGERAIFALLAVHGLAMILFLWRGLPEVSVPDLARIRLSRLVASFARLLGSADFMLPALAVAGVSGMLYGQAAIVPTLLMDGIGLSPAQFGLVMSLQAGVHVAGSLSARFWLSRAAALRLVPWAQAGLVLAVVWMLAVLAIPGHSTLGIIGPISLAAFSAAHSYPTFITAGFNDFPEIAGAAASLVGFLQMGAGFAVGFAAALVGRPDLAFGLVLPLSLAMSLASGLVWLIRARPSPGPAGDQPR